jgi:hypothetical protein
MTTQMCFSSSALTAWLHDVREQGIVPQAIVKVPGCVDARSCSPSR